MLIAHSTEFKVNSKKIGSLPRDELHVVVTDSHTGVVTVTDEGRGVDSQSATALLDVLDLSRAVAAAADPALAFNVTIRGADGTLALDSYDTFCDFRGRSYETGGDVRISIEVDEVLKLSAFLEGAAASHPLADSGEASCLESTPDTYETVGFGWGDGQLRLTPCEGGIVVTAETVRQGLGLVESMTVPLGSFAAMMRLAGGDLPGRGSFRTVRGDLSFGFGQYFALELTVASDEVDGARAQVWLDIEQVQELRRLMSAWGCGNGHLDGGPGDRPAGSS